MRNAGTKAPHQVRSTKHDKPSQTKTLELELKQGWLTIWFNQPDNRNALI